MGACAVVVAIALVCTQSYGTVSSPVEPAQPVSIAPGAAERLAGALRIPTVSTDDPADFDAEAFRAMHRYLEAAFQRVHAQLRRETVAEHSLLYSWPGSDPALNGVLLLAHLDVVPVEAGTEAEWEQPPFAGRIADGFIWGRGAIDDKSSVVATLEAVEMLLAEGFRPTRTVYLAFGHDEEVGGTQGAQEIAALLERRQVELELVLDEGGVIGDGVLPGLDAPVALVGIAEKGFLSLELKTRAAGGHSSLPPRQSAIGVLSAAIARLENEPLRAHLEGATEQLFEGIGPRLPIARRAMFANLWLTRPLVTRALEASPTTNAMLRTTTAATVFHAGTKDNLLPSQARAVINFRILQGDSVAGVVQHVRRVIDDDRIEVKNVGRFSAEPSPPASTQAESYQTLERTIRSIEPDVTVAPYLVVVVTDSRYFVPRSANVLRFLPLRLGSHDLARMHGTNERISIHAHEQAVRFYRQLLLNAA
jgi:carboxypeptidase PM20D1